MRAIMPRFDRNRFCAAGLPGNSSPLAPVKARDALASENARHRLHPFGCEKHSRFATPHQNKGLRAFSTEPVVLSPMGDPAADDRASRVRHIKSKQSTLTEIEERLGAVRICAVIHHRGLPTLCRMGSYEHIPILRYVVK
jgi:hypothetical protein